MTTATLSAKGLSKKDLICTSLYDPSEIWEILELGGSVKANPAPFSRSLAGKTVVLLFEKSSLRTRVTFEVGVHKLGGNTIFLDHQKVKLGERESIRDVAKNLERWTHGIVARTYKQRSVVELAQNCSVPVINGLTDLLHPCQALSDFFTMLEKFGTLKDLKLCYVGDGNNTCHSLLYTSAKLGVHMAAITPEGYEPNSRVVNEAMHFAEATGSRITITNDVEAVKGAQVVYTDVWASMGQEAETEERAAIFADYRVDDEVMEKAGPQAVFMHCLPAHRGSEVSASVIDSERSIVYDQAENRLHVQNAILLLLVGGIGKEKP